MVNKKQCLEMFFTEINILTECRHSNVVKILDASFDGTILKEHLMESTKPQPKPKDEEQCQPDEQDLFDLKDSSVAKFSKSSQIEAELKHKEDKYEQQRLDQEQLDASETVDDQPQKIKMMQSDQSSKKMAKSKQLTISQRGSAIKKHESIEGEYLVVKRKTEVCYYVMKLAEYGELYSFIEHTEGFDESMTRYIFDQVLEGVKYLHSNGIVHRDIKPENLLINKKGRILIADFSFATRMKELETDGVFKKTYDPIVDKKHDVGSEAYNAPEIWDNEINLQEFE